MEELFQSSLPVQGAVLAVAFLLCLAPHLGSNGRSLVAGLLLLPAMALLVDLLAVDHGFVQTLDVPNVFARGPDAEPHLWVVGHVSAPAWHWHTVAIALFGLPALLLWLRRHRPAGPPSPIAMAALVFWFFLAGRLALEASAAPRPVVWGVGATIALVVVLPFFGYWCGRKGHGAGRFVGQLALLAVVQRAPLVAFAWFATHRHLGTHLDTHVITDISLWPFGEVQLTDDFERWYWPHLVPHSTLWLVATVLFGSLLGLVPLWLGRRQAATATS